MSKPAFQNAPWSSEQIARLRVLWVDTSKGADDIAAELKRTWQSCRVKAGFERFGRRPPGVPTEKNAFWTAARIETLRSGIARGRSHTQIAAEIGHGCTRNACIGKAMRLGLAQPPRASAPSRLTMRVTSSTRRAPPKPKTPPKPRMVVCGNNTVIAHPERPPLVVTRKDVWKPLPDSTPRPFWERGLDFCKWPVEVEGQDEAVMRCCLPVERGGYCRDHAAVGFATTKPQRERVVRDLLRTARRYA